jgi:hypothetical protein
MEQELEIPSSLLSPPRRDMVSLSKSQLGFMNLFAIPLFQGVADIMPSMKYTVDELDINKALFEQGIRDEQAKEEPQGRRAVADGTFSPRTMTPIVPGTENNSKSTPQAPPVITPEALTDGERPAEKEFGSPPACPATKPAHVPVMAEEYKEMNGGTNSFDAVVDFAASDPFNTHRYRLDSFGDVKAMPPGKQRCSETTDGSNSVPYSAGDWASQVTSATTGKMPLSPSTQGTSIVSRDSLERPSSVPRPGSASGLVGLGEPSRPTVALAPLDADVITEAPRDDDSTSNGSMGKAEGKALKKRPSRFRMEALAGIFRRNRTATGPVASATDAVV